MAQRDSSGGESRKGRNWSGTDPYYRHWRGPAGRFRNRQARIASPPTAASEEAPQEKNCTARSPWVFLAGTRFQSGRVWMLWLAIVPREVQPQDAAAFRETWQELPQL